MVLFLGGETFKADTLNNRLPISISSNPNFNPEITVIKNSIFVVPSNFSGSIEFTHSVQYAIAFHDTSTNEHQFGCTWADFEITYPKLSPKFIDREAFLKSPQFDELLFNFKKFVFDKLNGDAKMGHKD